MSEDVALLVGGFRYEGWKSVRITRSIESIAGSFALDVSDRWDGRFDPWPILEEDPCRVEIDGTVVIDGYVDKRSISAAATSRTLSYTGRDRAAALVDCSAILDRWTLRDVDVAEFVTNVAAPFGVRVSVQSGLKLSRVPKVSFSPGDAAFDVIKQVAESDGVLIVSDGAGGIKITRSGTARATPLVEAENIVSASVEYDAAGRFHHYVIATQPGSTDEASGDAVRIAAGAVDEGVRRTNRVALIQPERGYSMADARKRADWEARIRAARATAVTIVVLGWKQPSGALWPINALTRVRAPRLIDIDGDMLISQVEHSIGEQGKVTQLRLVRPDAFTPEPVSAKVAARPRGWPEVRKGAAFDAELAAKRVADYISKMTKGGK
jgi:prophage tail gpP-like protein